MYKKSQSLLILLSIMLISLLLIYNLGKELGRYLHSI